MANHGDVRLPWGVPPAVLKLYAQEMMKAVFGGYIVPAEEELGVDPDSGELCLRFVDAYAKEDERMSTTQIWSESSRHIEVRHGARAFLRVAQDVEFQTLCASFGATTFWDDGTNSLSKPGHFELLTLRPFNGGLPEEVFLDKSDPFSKLLTKLEGDAFLRAPKKTWLWHLDEKRYALAQKLLDPIFLKAPMLTIKDFMSMNMEDESVVKMRKEDTVYWKHKLDWAGIIDAKYPVAKKLEVPSANAMLLPSASVGIACSKVALSRASETGLTRALAVALVWGNPDVARDIHQQLIKKSKDIESSEWKAKSTAEVLIGKMNKADQKISGMAMGGEDEVRLMAAQSLMESLVLSRQVKIRQEDGVSPSSMIKRKSSI